MDQIAYFLFSLDTELALGHYDHFDPTQFSPQGLRERKSIDRLLSMLDKFNITATWALVGHLFYTECEECDICPILEWEGKYQSFNDIYLSNNQLWYGADIVEKLLNRTGKREIAFHGYTHRVFDESQMTESEARLEIQEWLRVASRCGIVPESVVFPRSVAGHLGAFKDNGFICYRGEKLMSGTYSVPLLGKLINRADLILQFMVPESYDPRIDASGLVHLPSSQWLFRISRRIELLLDLLNLHTFRIRRITKGVDRAVAEKKIIHIWAHPFEFKTDKDFEKLRHLLAHVAEQVEKGRMRSVGMAELARLYLKEQEQAVGTSLRSA